MNPSKEETNAVLERIVQMENDAEFYRQLGEHNRVLARERIGIYRARRLEEMQVASPTQMRSVVRGDDRYQPNRSGLYFIGLLTAILLIGYAILRSV